MATMNLNSIVKSAQEHNVTEYQLIMGSSKSGKNVNAILVGGYKFDRLSNLTKAEIDIIMDDIACNGVAVAYEHHTYGRNSVAKQKVNEGHGRSNDERLAYLLEQMMTYAKRFSGVQFIGQTMESVFDQLIERETITLEQWVKGMKDWHGVNAKAKVLDAIKNKTMHIVEDKAICDVTFRNFITEYAKQNKLTIPNEEQKGQMIAVYLKGLERV